MHLQGVVKYYRLRYEIFPTGYFVLKVWSSTIGSLGGCYGAPAGRFRAVEGSLESDRLTLRRVSTS